jgi:pSer/pThr/pTyr-binding forkhead associated (FHA) protein
MNPRLIGIAGPLEGATFGLDEEELSIGREPGNNLTIEDLRMSRRHCFLKKEAEAYTITDLESRNGTFVNGVPVKERRLEHGDQIRVGQSVFVFLARDAEVDETSSPVQVEDQAWIARSGAELQAGETLYLRPLAPGAELPVTERVVRDLNALVRISTAISSLPSLEAIQKNLLDSVFEVIPAEHGAVILCEEGSETFASAVSKHRTQRPIRPKSPAMAGCCRWHGGPGVRECSPPGMAAR